MRVQQAKDAQDNEVYVTRGTVPATARKYFVRGTDLHSADEQVSALVSRGVALSDAKDDFADCDVTKKYPLSYFAQYNDEIGIAVSVDAAWRLPPPVLTKKEKRIFKGLDDAHKRMYNHT
ncbi:MAG: hypothetical protein MHM6MM_001256 [Cercozoa sp. M6MM]